MNLTLKRTQYVASGIFGSILDDQDQEVVVTLEHAYYDDQKGWGAKIPAGVYTCIRRLSPRFGYYVFLITNVPGHDFCEIHCGNQEADSEGCILVGEKQLGSVILHSRDAFDKLMKLQTGVDMFLLSITDIGGS